MRDDALPPPPTDLAPPAASGEGRIEARFFRRFALTSVVFGLVLAVSALAHEMGHQIADRAESQVERTETARTQVQQMAVLARAKNGGPELATAGRRLARACRPVTFGGAGAALARILDEGLLRSPCDAPRVAGKLDALIRMNTGGAAMAATASNLLPALDDLVVEHRARAAWAGRVDLMIDHGSRVLVFVAVIVFGLLLLYPFAARLGSERRALELSRNDLEARVAARSRKLEQARENLRASAALFENTFMSAGVGITMISLNGRFLQANKSFAGMLGYEPRDLIGRSFLELTHPDDRDRTAAAKERVFAGDAPSAELEKRYLHRDGHTVWARIALTVVNDATGLPLHGVATVQDITARKKAETALAESEARYRTIVETAMEGIWTIDAAGITTFVNQRLAEMLGHDHEDMIGRPVFDFMDAEAQREAEYQIGRRRQGIAEVHEFRLQNRHGKDLWTQIAGNPLFDEDGNYAGAMAMVTDVTERKRTEDDLRATRERLLNAQRIAGIGSWDWDIAGDAITWSESVFPILGLEAGAVAPGYERFFDVVHPDDRAAVEAAIQRAFETGEPYRADHRIVRPDGEVRVLHERGEVVFDATGAPLRMAGTMQDITERRRNEQRLQDQEHRIRAILEAMPYGVLSLDAGGRIVDANRAAGVIFGYPADALPQRAFAALLVEEDAAAFETGLAEHLGGSEDALQGPLEMEGRHAAGPVFPIRVRVDDVPGGDFTTVLVVVEDLTRQRASEAERKAMEYELHQAQKMEAIGQMAGGMAHEFNNVLVPMIGLTELVRDDMEAEATARKHLDTVLAAGERARHLIKKILSFSRMKDEIGPGPIRLDEVVRDAVSVLQVGIPSIIQVETSLADESLVIQADPDDIHQVIMNLGVNARDALGDRPGGRIDIGLSAVDVPDAAPEPEFHELPPGRYAAMTFADNGDGMSRAVRDRVFDPFFTTKDIGRGTGMGLSVVHGIVMRCQGGIRVDSEESGGTAFKILFPLAGEVEGPSGPGALD